MTPPHDGHVLAIDLGTSGPKVALLTLRGELVGHEFEPNEVMVLPDGGAEQDPAMWWSSISAASQRLLARGLVPVDSIRAVGVTSQWSGTVPVGADGQPVGNAVIWMDSRGQRYIRDLCGGPLSVDGYSLPLAYKWIKRSGGMPGMAGKDPIAHMLWLKHERPEIYQSTSTFLEVKDYVNLLLTGRRTATYDSIVLNWVTDNRDIEQVRYDPWLLQMTGLDPDKFPELMQATEVVGPLSAQAAEALGLPAGVPVIGGTPDVQSAAIGSGAVLDYQGHVYVGTSSWLVCHVPFKKCDIFHSMASLPAPLPGRYLLTNEQETAGGALNFLRDRLFFADDELTDEAWRARGEPDHTYQAFDRLVQSVPPGAEGLVFTPWLYGERAPVEDHHLRASFFNLSLEHHRGHMVRAVYEGVANNSRWLMKHVEAFCKRPFPHLRIIGGGARSDVWCQIYADVLDREIHQVADPIHAGVRGVAFLAALSLGALEVEDIPELVPVKQRFQPDPDHRELYDRRFGEYLRFYKATRGIHARL